MLGGRKNDISGGGESNICFQLSLVTDPQEQPQTSHA